MPPVKPEVSQMILQYWSQITLSGGRGEVLRPKVGYFLINDYRVCLDAVTPNSAPKESIGIKY